MLSLPWVLPLENHQLEEPRRREEERIGRGGLPGGAGTGGAGAAATTIALPAGRPAAAARFSVTESCVQGGEGEDNLSLSPFLNFFSIQNL